MSSAVRAGLAVCCPVLAGLALLGLHESAARTDGDGVGVVLSELHNEVSLLAAAGADAPVAADLARPRGPSALMFALTLTTVSLVVAMIAAGIFLRRMGVFGQDEPKPRLPVIILTGYLGAGKTTLLNYILHEQAGKRLAVIENEIGEVSVDDALVEGKAEDLAEELVVLENGCVCCTIRGDLLKTLQGFVHKVRGGLKLDGILVELTGAADPAPVVQTFMLDDSVRASFYIDNVVTLVDAKHAIEKLDESKAGNQSTVCAQIAFSSTVLLNKVDLVDEAATDAVEKRVKELNASVEIIRCEQARVPLDKLFNVRAFDLARVLEEQYMDEEEFNNFYEPKMDNTISNVGLKFSGAINNFQFQMLLDDLIGDEDSAKDFMRIKGVLHVQGSTNMFVMQCVHMVRNQNFTKPWATPTPENRLIFIGRGMQQRRRQLTEAVMACIVKPLRFAMGEAVMVKVGFGKDGWLGGKVVKHWDGFHAYRVRTMHGEVHVPVDSDDFVVGFAKK